MQDKMIFELLNRYKELAYSRRSMLRTIYEVTQNRELPHDERIFQIARLCEASGIFVRQEENQEG